MSLKFSKTKVPSTPPSRPSDVFGTYVSAKGEASPYFLKTGSEVPEYFYRPMSIKCTFILPVQKPRGEPNDKIRNKKGGLEIQAEILTVQLRIIIFLILQ